MFAPGSASPLRHTPQAGVRHDPAGLGSISTGLYASVSSYEIERPSRQCERRETRLFVGSDALAVENLTPTAVSAPERDRTRPPRRSRRRWSGSSLALALAPARVRPRGPRPFTTPKRAVFGVAMTGLLVVAWSGRLRRGIALATGPSSAWRFSSSRRSSRPRSRAVPEPGGRRAPGPRVPRASAAALGCAAPRVDPRRVLLCANALGVGAFLIAIVGILQHQRLDWWGFRPTSTPARGGGPAPSPDLLEAPVVGALLRAVYGGARLDCRDGRVGRSAARSGTAAARAPSRGSRRSTARRPCSATRTSRPKSSRPGSSRSSSPRAPRGRARAAGGRGRLPSSPRLRSSRWRRWRSTSRSPGTRGAWVGLLAAAAVLAASFVIQAPPGRRGARIAIVLVGTCVVGGRRGFFAARGSESPAAGRAPPRSTLDRVTALFRKARSRPRHDPRAPHALGQHPCDAGRVRGSPGPSACCSESAPGTGRSSIRCTIATSGATRSAPTRSSAIPIIPHQDALEFLADHGLIGAASDRGFPRSRLSQAASRGRPRTRPQGRYAALALLGGPRRARSRLALLVPAPPRAVSRHRVPRVRRRARGGRPAIRAPSRALAVGRRPGLLVRGNGGPRGSSGWRRSPPRAVALVAAGAVRLLRGAAPGRCACGVPPRCSSAGARSRSRRSPGARRRSTRRVASSAAESSRSRRSASTASVVWQAAAVARSSSSCPSSRVGVAALGGAARVQASKDFQLAGDHALGARLIPSETARATALAREAYDRATAGQPRRLLRRDRVGPTS